ncbi:hypothetical protein [Photobacterium damselae]|uniref:hypothetical protein n=1 Tax=Photobacterium damselae TaxID=38293 RepID=UPI001E60FD9F|nr:hypothetical protein [Photobacterium damselae]
MAKNEILIIESRNAQDIYDDRYEGATLKEVLKLQGISAKHFEVVNKVYFGKAIKYAASENIKYVHFSGHGSEKGIELTDGFITWKELDQIAWPYLKDTCLCFSSCDVARGVDEIFEYHKSFCNAVIAPTREISWGEGLVAYSALYHRALSCSTSSSQDVRVLNHIVGAGTFSFIASTFRSTTYSVG